MSLIKESVTNNSDGINNLQQSENIGNIGNIGNVGNIGNIGNVGNIGNIGNSSSVIKKTDDTATIEDILNENIFGFDSLQKIIYYMHHKSFITLLTIMAKNNHIIQKEYLDAYFLKIVPGIIKQYSNSTAKKRRNNNANIQKCMARKSDSTQCTRQPSGQSEYCKSHQKTLPCGRIDQQVINTPHINKRGRKSKFKYDPRLNDNDYITLFEDIADGMRVLSDFNRNIYSYDLNSPIYLGKKMLDGKIDSSWVRPEGPNNCVKQL